MARPTGAGRVLATYEIPIEGRDEWVAATGRLAFENGLELVEGLPAPSRTATSRSSSPSSGLARTGGSLLRD
jgi:hypothetical protein